MELPELRKRFKLPVKTDGERLILENEGVVIPVTWLEPVINKIGGKREVQLDIETEGINIYLFGSLPPPPHRCLQKACTPRRHIVRLMGLPESWRSIARRLQAAQAG